MDGLFSAPPRGLPVGDSPWDPPIGLVASLLSIFPATRSPRPSDSSACTLTRTRATSLENTPVLRPRFVGQIL
jgi:hypothetical protein